MDKITEEKLARSLTAENTLLIPHLPYLLQDLWELGSPADDVIALIKDNIPAYHNMNVLDLACGKGAMGMPVARELQCSVKMIDIFPEFVDFARKKANEYSVEDICSFAVEDITLSVEKERGWDCTMLLAVGDVLGNVDETLRRLSRTVGPGGYIIIDDTHIPDDGGHDIRYQYEYLTEKDWLDAYRKNGLTLIAKAEDSYEWIADQNDNSNKAIAQRAEELSKKYPHLRNLFDEYVVSQLNESHDVENSLISSLCLLQRQN